MTKKYSKRIVFRSVVWVMLPTTILVGWFYPILGFMVLFCMFSGITIAFFKGKFWCAWLCPRGSFLDKFIGPLSLKKSRNGFFQTNVLRITILVPLMSLTILQIYRVWPNINNIGTIMVLLLSATTLVALLLGFFMHPRSWCTICPVGTVSGWISDNRNKKKKNKKLVEVPGIEPGSASLQL